MECLIKKRIQDSIDVKQEILVCEGLLATVRELSMSMIASIKKGGRIILCGNGGSASDALHFAGEIVGRFQKEREAWPVIVLNSDVATMTAIANDYGYENVFARQVEGHITGKDILVGISTSGNSENIYRALRTAKNAGAKTAALLGKDGGKIGKAVDYPVVVPSMVTARVQESHILLIHILCELIEDNLADSNQRNLGWGNARND